MKKLTKILACAVFALSLTAITGCSKNDDTPENSGNKTETPKTIWVTEVQQKEEGIYKPYLQFIYDANNRLTKVVEDYDGDGDGLYIWDFARGNDGKITRIKYTSDNGASIHYDMEVTYNGNNITQLRNISGSGDGDPSDIIIYKYAWTNGKITKVESFHVREQETAWTDVFTYVNGNCADEEGSDSYVNSSGDKCETAYKGTYQFNTAKANWMTYQPVEYIVVKMIENAHGYYMTENEIISTENIHTTITKDASTNKELSKGIDVYKRTYTYTNYNSTTGLATEYSMRNYSTRSYTDYEYPSNNSSGVYDDETRYFKIVYNK